MAQGRGRARKIVPISNLPKRVASTPTVVSDEHIFHQHQRDVMHLKAEIERLLVCIHFRDRALEDEIAMWETGLEMGEWESYDAVKRRVSRLRGARKYRGF